jgi:hypothetical protein
MPKYMPMMFFYFLKIIFNISTIKRYKKYKPHSILSKKNNQNLTKHRLKRTAKQALKSKSYHHCLVLRLNLLFTEFQFFFFLLKLSAVCTFWIVLMCWCQKWFLKNEKTSLACISARKAIWKATTTTLPNTL